VLTIRAGALAAALVVATTVIPVLLEFLGARSIGLTYQGRYTLPLAVGIPVLAAIPQAVQALAELGLHRKVQLIVSGGIRTGADVAKAMALGADAVSIGTAALIALGDNHPRYAAQYEQLGSAAGFYDDYQDGRDPAGITTQDPSLAARLDPVEGGRRVANYLRVLTMEAQTIARACGKAHLQHLEPEDLVALTIESAAMARVPLAGTSWIPGW